MSMTEEELDAAADVVQDELHALLESEGLDAVYQIVFDALIASSHGEPLSEIDELRVTYAATLVVSLQLVARGLDPDEVADMFTRRGHSFKFNLDEEGLSISVLWDDEDGNPGEWDE